MPKLRANSFQWFMYSPHSYDPQPHALQNIIISPDYNNGSFSFFLQETKHLHIHFCIKINEEKEIETENKNKDIYRSNELIGRYIIVLYFSFVENSRASLRFSIFIEMFAPTHVFFSIEFLCFANESGNICGWLIGCESLRYCKKIYKINRTMD